MVKNSINHTRKIFKYDIHQIKLLIFIWLSGNFLTQKKPELSSQIPSENDLKIDKYIGIEELVGHGVSVNF